MCNQNYNIHSARNDCFFFVRQRKKKGIYELEKKQLEIK